MMGAEAMALALLAGNAAAGWAVFFRLGGILARLAVVEVEISSLKGARNGLVSQEAH